MAARNLRPFRRWVQLAAFLLFLYLLIWAGRTGFIPADLFFRLDPLAALGNGLAARRLVPSLLIGAALAVAAALVVGRFWCGWLCPLGTVLDWTPGRAARPNEADLSPRWRQVKYFLLFLILFAALLGNATFLFLDPITLIYRTATAAAWPALNALITGIETALYNVPFLQGPLDAFEAGVRGAFLPAYQPLYGAGALAALLFGGVLALNAVRERFWCRYLCPLGALLGLVSKAAWLRRTVSGECIECRRCERACPTGAIEAQRGFASDPAECIMCLECAPVCARAGQRFVGRLPWAAGETSQSLLVHGRAGRPARSEGPSRRQFVASAAVAVTAAGLFGAERAAGRPDVRLIRPPGAAQPGFLSQCIRCGVCLKVCPTSGLQPSFTTAGWAGVWSPVLVPRLGQCSFACNACGQACPTGAIPPLTVEEKQVTVIGHAYVDRSRCLPWASARNCIVCEEMCPLPEKAIQLEETEVWAPDGATVTVKRPHVLQDRCIGCGICENRCPLAGEAAIHVYAPSNLNVAG